MKVFHSKAGLFVYRWFWFSLIFLFLLLAMITMAVEPTKVTPTQLEQLENRIQKLQAEIHTTQTQYRQLQHYLQNSEENIGEIAQRLENLHDSLTDKQNTLNYLKQQITEQDSKLAAQREVLAQQIRAAYMTGRQSYLKLWLNQQDPFIIGRVLAYYDYFNRAQTRQIIAIKETRKNLQTLKQTLEQESKQLKQLVQAHQEEKQTLELNYSERQKILLQLANSLESQTEELKRLQEERRQLAAILGDHNMMNREESELFKPAFFELKGRLSFPVKGKVVKRFGQPLVGDLKWQGTLIHAPLGEKVRVVASGRVVFAQWFRHFGLLAIIEHGEGYMSLYAHNQSLYVKAGDWVKAQDVIATVGNSGGHQQAGLYFEIRHQGVPQPPEEWLLNGEW
jgi:septal ring factor EnvC (AmiA/AmiB activator)